MNNTQARSACANCASATDDTIDLGRRQFIAAGFMAAAAAALAACAGGGSDLPTSPGNVGLTIKVSDYASLASVGGVATLSANGTPLAIVRTGATSFAALSRVCPHQGTTVNVTSTGFLCPNHGAQFNKSGTWVGGERTSSMHSYSTSYVASTDTLTIG